MANYTAQELKLDYFNFYDVADQQAGQICGVECQFDKEMERIQLTRLNLFANPASKNGEEMYDKNAHLTWYDAYDPAPDPMRQVAYANQFGEGKLITGRSYALLTPTWKIEEGSAFPTQLDHYRVYQVLQADPPGPKLKLADQFGSQETQVYMPRFFAVPTKKYYEGHAFEINNSTAHLVIYQIYPKMVEKTIRAKDQFGQRYLQAFRSILLGVPSLKTKWQEMD